MYLVTFSEPGYLALVFRGSDNDDNWRTNFAYAFAPYPDDNCDGYCMVSLHVKMLKLLNCRGTTMVADHMVLQYIQWLAKMCFRPGARGLLDSFQNADCSHADS